MSILVSIILLQAAASPPTVATAPADDAKIVCKTVNETGSRLGGKRVCLSKKEWRRMQDEAKETASFHQDHQSKQPGNQ